MSYPSYSYDCNCATEPVYQSSMYAGTDASPNGVAGPNFDGGAGPNGPVGPNPTLAPPGPNPTPGPNRTIAPPAPGLTAGRPNPVAQNGPTPAIEQ
jgi:hypothetical protein